MEITEKTISDLIHKWVEIKKKDREFNEFFMKYMTRNGKVMIYTEELDYVIKISSQKLVYKVNQNDLKSKYPEIYKELQNNNLKSKYPEIYNDLKELYLKSSSVSLKKCKKKQQP